MDDTQPQSVVIIPNRAQDEMLVPLCDISGEIVGAAEKLKVHQSGDLHRAVSLFVINEWKEVLLQRRALGKYHSGGLWSNACCTHPFVAETTNEAVVRRSREELGLSVSPSFLTRIYYNVQVGNKLTEHELTDVFLAEAHSGIVLQHDPVEVHETDWVPIEKLVHSLDRSPQYFTAWLPIVLQPIVDRVVGKRSIAG